MTAKNERRHNIAGIVLAGGQPSRMGKNKALLDFRGRPLVEHMMTVLDDCGIRDVFVSGALEDYPCLPDDTPFSGPAAAMVDCLTRLRNDNYDGVLFVPVDMPFITKGLLKKLFQDGRTSCFENKPLPAYITIDSVVREKTDTVEFLLKAMGVNFIPVHDNCKKAFTNINTHK